MPCASSFERVPRPKTASGPCVFACLTGHKLLMVLCISCIGKGCTSLALLGVVQCHAFHACAVWGYRGAAYTSHTFSGRAGYELFTAACKPSSSMRRPLGFPVVASAWSRLYAACYNIPSQFLHTGRVPSCRCIYGSPDCARMLRLFPQLCPFARGSFSVALSNTLGSPCLCILTGFASRALLSERQLYLYCLSVFIVCSAGMVSNRCLP